MKFAGNGLIAFIIGLGLVLAPHATWAEKSLTIKMASWDPPLILDMEKTNGNFGSTNIKAQMFKKVIEKSSRGRIKVTILPNGQIGGDKEAFEMMQAGALDMSAYPGSIVANFVPECYAYQIPFLFKNHTVANQVMDGPFGEELKDLVLKKTGVRVLRWGTETFMDYMTSGTEVKVPGDMKGKKIRTIAQPNYIEMTKIAGASPTPIPFAELYTSLQQGVVDGTLTPMAVVEMFKLEQGLKYICQTDVSYLIGVVAASEIFWKKLSDEDKKLVVDAAYQASEFHRAMLLYGSHMFGDSLAKKGVTIYTPSLEEREQWKKTLHAPMVDWTRKQIGDEWVDKIIKAVADVENRLYR